MLTPLLYSFISWYFFLQNYFSPLAALCILTPIFFLMTSFFWMDNEGGRQAFLDACNISPHSEHQHHLGTHSHISLLSCLIQAWLYSGIRGTRLLPGLRANLLLSDGLIWKPFSLQMVSSRMCVWHGSGQWAVSWKISLFIEQGHEKGTFPFSASGYYLLTLELWQQSWHHEWSQSKKKRSLCPEVEQQNENIKKTWVLKLPVLKAL